jgi:hypothetical protein
MNRRTKTTPPAIELTGDITNGTVVTGSPPTGKLFKSGFKIKPNADGQLMIKRDGTKTMTLSIMAGGYGGYPFESTWVDTSTYASVSRDSADPPSTRRSRARARVLVHAGLLPGMASAQSLGASTLRRRESPGPRRPRHAGDAVAAGGPQRHAPGKPSSATQRTPSGP